MPPITDDMRRLVDQAGLSFVATVCPDGTPNLSPKATVAVLDDEHLVFVNINSPQTVANLRQNPAVELNAIDIFIRRGYRFKGRAEVLDGGPLYDQIVTDLRARLGPDYPAHHVVKIKVEHAAPVVSPAYIFSDPIPTEAELKQSFLTRYGVRALAAEEQREPAEVSPRR